MTPPDADLIGFATAVAPEVDSAFVTGMTVPRERGGMDVVAAHGGLDAVGGLVEFRTVLTSVDRVVTAAQWHGAWRYRNIADGERWIDGRAAAGTLERVGGGFRATPAGAAFITAIRRHQGAVLDEHWGDVTPLLAPMQRVHDAAAATAGPSYAAMLPTAPDPAASAALTLLDLLGGIRYHRADAHAAAWHAAGVTAAGIAAMAPGPARDRIENETNRRAAPPWAAIDAATRAMVLAGLADLPGPQ